MYIMYKMEIYEKLHKRQTETQKNTGIPALRYPAFFLHRHAGAAHMLITYRYAYGNVR